MSSVVKQRVGNHIYLYESVSFRDPDGNPRNNRFPIGKIDLKTNVPIYKPEYLARMEAAGTPIKIAPTDVLYSINDIRQSCIREFGTFHLFYSLAVATGLVEVLSKALPENWKEVFTLACYLVSSGDSYCYCEDWLANTESLAVGNMSSQRISELLHGITSEDRNNFYDAWIKYRSEKEYLALDITSISSYSQLIDDVEWGYNRDCESLPQINLCMLFGEKSRLPVYQTIYNGSLKDVSTLKTTLSQIFSFKTDKKILIVMDKGFCSARNIDAMLQNENGLRFIIALPFTMSFARRQVASEVKGIDTIWNTIVLGGDSLRGVARQRSWNRDHKVYVHTYYNAMKAMKHREDLYAHVTRLREVAGQDPGNCRYQDDFNKYLVIRNSGKSSTGFTVNIREDVIQNELETAGWMILVSNDVSDARIALSIYREKDVIEKGFLKLKNNLDLGRMRIHSETSMQNKVFIGFIALILMSHIHRTMLEKNLYKNMTMKKMFKTLEKLRLQEIKDTRILYPLTKEQKSIFKAFDIDEPV